MPPAQKGPIKSKNSSSTAGRKRKASTSTEIEAVPKRAAVAAAPAAATPTKPTQHSSKRSQATNVRALGDDNWQSLFFRLAVYKQRHGDTNPSPQDKDPDLAQLGNWVKRQRSKKGKAELMTDQVDALNAIRFSWNPRIDEMNREWDKRFQELVEFKREHGHCRVPTSHKDPDGSGGLGAWVSRQRDAQQLYERLQKSGKCQTDIIDNGKTIQEPQCRAMTQAHREKLDSMGFVWKIFQRSGFDGKVAELLEYKEKFGNCNVPQHWPENKSLGKFVARQRYHYCLLQQGKKDKNPLTPERIAKLDEIGFSWGKVRPNTWKDPKTEKAKEKAEEARAKANSGLVSGAQKSILNMGDLVPLGKRRTEDDDNDDSDSCSD